MQSSDTVVEGGGWRERYRQEVDRRERWRSVDRAMDEQEWGRLMEW